MIGCLWACLVAALLIASDASASVASPAVPASEPEWVVAAPKPESNPGLLFIPDDSEATAVFRCTVSVCNPDATICTARVFPEKPDVWHSANAGETLANTDLHFFSGFFFIENDTQRLAPAFREAVDWASSDKVILRSDGEPLRVGDRDAVMSQIIYQGRAASWTFNVLVWIERDRLHRNTCLASGDEALSKAATLDFAAGH